MSTLFNSSLLNSAPQGFSVLLPFTHQSKASSLTVQNLNSKNLAVQGLLAGQALKHSKCGPKNCQAAKNSLQRVWNLKAEGGKGCDRKCFIFPSLNVEFPFIYGFFLFRQITVLSTSPFKLPRALEFIKQIEQTFFFFKQSSGFFLVFFFF